MKIGIIGAGMIGSTVGKLWVDAGHEVRFASRHPEELAPLVASLGERASTGTPAEAAAFGDVVMVTIPLVALPQLARDVSLANKVVLDTSNAYERRDGDAAGEATKHAQNPPRGGGGGVPPARWGGGVKTGCFKKPGNTGRRGGGRRRRSP